MESKELMIGDWVSISMAIPNGSVFEWTDFKNLQIGSIDQVDRGYMRCVPIPLTFDILKASDFECFDSGEDDCWNGYVKRSDKGGLCSVRILANLNEGFRCIILVEGKTDNRDEIYVTVYYVHQLQHLLRVCGLSDMADKLKIE